MLTTLNEHVLFLDIEVVYKQKVSLVWVLVVHTLPPPHRQSTHWGCSLRLFVGLKGMGFTMMGDKGIHTVI
jgi:hypothetical protein